MNRVAVLLAGLLVCGTAQAKPAPWYGTWRVKGSLKTRTVKVVLGGMKVALDLGKRGKVEVQGKGANRSAIEFKGTLPRARGITGALEGADSESDRQVVLKGTQQSAAESEDLTAKVQVHLDGNLVLHETWIRAGEPRLELLSITPSQFDPKSKKPFQIRFRIHGQPMRVKLRVHMPSKFTDSGWWYRTKVFEYWRNVVFAGKQTALLDVGVHAVTWSGRDDSKAKRLLLHGKYGIDLLGQTESTTLRSKKKTVTFLKPVFSRITPYFPKDGKEWNARYKVAGKAIVIPELTRGFRVRHEVKRLNGVDMARILDGSASAMVYGHGGWHQELGGGLQGSDGYYLASDHAALYKGRLKDLHFALLHTCYAGRDANPGEKSLPTGLIEAGVDVVVAFAYTVQIGGPVEHYSQTFLRLSVTRLMRKALPIRGAILQAAKGTDIAVYLTNSAAKRKKWRKDPDTNFRGYQEAIRVSVAPGIDPTQETLWPARYGNSTN